MADFFHQLPRSAHKSLCHFQYAISWHTDAKSCGGKSMTKTIFLLILMASIGGTAYPQRGTTFTGTAVIYGSGVSTRTITRPFTLIINGRTSPADATRYFRTLEQG